MHVYTYEMCVMYERSSVMYAYLACIWIHAYVRYLQMCWPEYRITVIVCRPTYTYVVYACVDIYLCEYGHVWVCVLPFVCVYVCICVYVSVYIYVCMYACMYVCVYVYMYVCVVYVCVYVCVCMYVLHTYVGTSVFCMYACTYVCISVLAVSFMTERILISLYFLKCSYSFWFVFLSLNVD